MPKERRGQTKHQDRKCGIFLTVSCSRIDIETAGWSFVRPQKIPITIRHSPFSYQNSIGVTS
eukprot:scaffold1323_cov113-Cylindrotheca_fusiformis.AAC.2